MLSAVFCTPDGFGADWPMWRCDARRSAATAQELPGELHLQWTLPLPRLEPAWPDEDRMRFDVAYEPIVMGKTLFYGSPRSDFVAALDTDTGAQKWKFYADGPVRFAPVAWNGKLYFACDDGYLYCLNAGDGSLLWKFRGGPSDRRVLGNTRLISAWPVRGAPVVVDGTVYFAAGIWPFMGIFIYALDAETGSVIWTNDGHGSRYMLQPHNSPAFAGVAPQGYLAVSGDKLVIPGGRSIPACFDRRTGEFLYYHLSANNRYGAYRASASDEYLFNSGCVWNLATGAIRGRLGSDPVVTEQAVYHAAKGTIQASDITRVEVEEVTDSKGRKSKKLTVPTMWKAPIKADTVWMKAGSRLFASKDDIVMALDLPLSGEEPKPSWEAEVEGKPHAVLAADDRLFVSTDEGRIHCFGPAEVRPRKMLRIPLGGGRNPPHEYASQILERTGVTEGYCVVLGTTDGGLAEELARQSKLQMIAIGPDPGRVAYARRRLDMAMRLDGARIAVHAGDIDSFALPPYMASLIVVEDLAAAGFDSSKEFAQSVFHALRPYGGVACLPISAEQHAGLARSVRQAGLERARLRRRGALSLLSREGPLPGAGDWTGQYGNPANTCVSKDSRVKAPLGLLWFGGSSNVTILPRHGHGPPEQVIGGRLFIEGPDSLRAMDVYTGRLLWLKQLPGIGDAYNYTSHEPGANAVGTNFIAADDAVYVAHGPRCLRLDPATGEQLSELTLPAAEGAADPPQWGFIGVAGDLLIAGASPVIFEGKEKIGKRDNWDATSSKRLVVMDRRSGKVLWSLDSVYCFRHNTIIVGAGKLFCIDRLPDVVMQQMERRGEKPTAEPRLMALDLRTGKPIWSTTENVFGTWLGYSEQHDVLLQAGRPSRDMLPNEPGDRMIAYRGADGTVLWDKPHKYYGPPLLKGDTIITQAITLTSVGKAFSLLSGEPRMRQNPITGEEAPWEFGRNYGCNTVIASEHLITFRSAAAGFFDLTTDCGTGNIGGFKSGCTSNLVVADGILNAPDYTRTCTCSYQNQTSLALIHMPEVEMWTFNKLSLGDEPVKRVGVNLGAPGDRMAQNGTLWLEYPAVGGPSPNLSVSLSPEKPQWFRRHSSRIEGEGLRWVGASGAKGLDALTIKLGGNGEQERAYSVALYFVEPEESQAGQRVFDVLLQGDEVLRDFDILKEAGAKNRVIVRRFPGIKVTQELTVGLRARTGAPVLCGVEIVESGK